MAVSRNEALEILQLSGSPSRDAVEQQFRKLAHQAHPDRDGSAHDFERIVAARDRLREDESDQQLVPATGNLPSAVATSSELVGIEKERDLARKRREASTRVTKGLIRAEVNRLTRWRRIAHLLTWLGGGAGVLTLALGGTIFQGVGRLESLWMANAVINVVVVSFTISAICAVAGFVISGQIARVEHSIDDAADAMSDRSTFLDLFYEIVDLLNGNNKTAWTSSELVEGVESWSVQYSTLKFWKRHRRRYGRRLKRCLYLPHEAKRRVMSVFGQLESNPSLADLALVIGPTGFVRLLITKGDEIGLLLPKEELEEGRLRVQYRLALELAG